MASPRLLLPVAFVLLTAGCDTPDEDYPRGHETIRIGSARFGVSAAVSISQSTDEWELCHVDKGEFLPWIDCEETRERAAKLVSIECQPAESCRDVTIDGAKGSFFPLVKTFTVKVVGEIEGSRVEKTQEVEVGSPAEHIRFSPEHTLPESYVALCRSAEAGVEMTFAVTSNGQPLEPVSAGRSTSRCLTFLTSSPGTIRAVPRVVDPGVELEAITATVHPFSDLSDVAIQDQLCFGKEVGAALEKDGTYLVIVGASGMLPVTPTARTFVTIPATRIRFVDRGRIVPYEGAERGTATFTLDEAPSPTARVELDLDGNVVSRPVRLGNCD